MEVLVGLKVAAHRLGPSSAEGLAAVLRWEGDARLLVEALAAAGLLRSVPGGWVAQWPGSGGRTPAGSRADGVSRNGKRPGKERSEAQEMRVWYGVLTQRIERAERLAQEAEEEEERGRWLKEARALKVERDRLQRRQAEAVLDRLQQPVLIQRP
jgi:hypothetical protein